jgi:ABC-type Fe3+ transport system substrate-binding protein
MLMKFRIPFLTVLGIAVGVTAAADAMAEDKLSAALANDPIAKALGAKVINAARKEGKVVWYGGTTTRKFVKRYKASKKLEKRFGIKIETVIGKNANLTERIKTEHAVGRVVVDSFFGNEQYANRFIKLGYVDSWLPPNTVLDELLPWVKGNIKGKNQFFPVTVSSQALMVNTDAVKPKDYPKSYWDIVNNPGRWKGKIAIRDPRAASGGAWMMMAIKHTPGLGLDFIKKLATLKPVLVSGGSKRLRNVIAKRQFELGFSGRGEFINDLPKGTPVEYVVPKEGFQWSRGGAVRFKKGPHPNASKVLLTWLLQFKQMQGYTNASGRTVAHPKVKVPVPQMSLTAYPPMPAIPVKNFANPNPFFKEMEKIFGIR